MAQDTPEKSILEKLALTQTFHPAGAKLFVPDWTLDPGDVVTVQSDGENYDVPIYSMDLTWNGACRADIQSTGNQQREPLSALRRKEYQTGRRGYGMQKEIEEETQQQYEHYTEQTDAYRKEIYRVNGVVYDSNGNIVYQTDPVTGEYILDNAGNKIPVYNPESNGSISGQVIQSAQRMATIIKQSGTVYEVFSETKQYYEGDRVLYPDSNGIPYKFINDHNPGPWKGDGEHGDVVSLGTLQSQIDNNTENFNIFYGDVNERLGTIEGSTLWGNADELVAINGRIRVENNKVIIEEGGGIVTERTVSGRTVQSGIWDAGNLTAGTIVQTINGTTETTIRADKVNLEGYVTASYVDTAVLLADSLTSDNGYIGNIKASNINTGGNINASGAVYGSGIYITSTSEQGKTIYTDLSNAVKTIQKNDDAPDGQIGIKFNTFGNATWIPINFNIADTAKYKADVGISSVDPGNWQYDSTEHKYYNPVVATANDSTQANPDTMTANVFIPDITLTPVVNGLTYVGKVNAWGPSVSGTVYAAADELSLYLKEKDNYVYITKTDSDPVPVGPNSNVVARMEIQGGGSEEDYDMGYADGQTNADAVIDTISHPAGDTAYLASYLNIDIYANPNLALTDQDGIISYIEKTGITDTIQIPVVVTPVSLDKGTISTSDDYTGVYTITGDGGNVNVDGQNGANIPVSTNSLQLSLQLGTPSTDLGTTGSTKWSSDNHNYVYNVSSSLSVDGTGNVLTREVKNITLVPTDAIDYGKSIVSATLKGATTQSTYTTLEPGYYGLYRVVDNVTESTAVNYYRVTSGGTSSVKYVVSSSGDPITVWNGLSIVGNLYPNTDVITGGTDQLNRIQVTYRGRTGYVGSSYISTTKGATNYIGRIGWTDEGSDASTRAVYSLSEVVLAPSDTGTSYHSVKVTYDDGTVVQNGATVTVDASAIDGGGGGGGEGGISSASIYAHSDEQSDWTDWTKDGYGNLDEKYGLIKINAKDGTSYYYGINASDVWQNGYTKGRTEVSPYNIEDLRTISITSNGTRTINPSSTQYDAMAAVKVTVNVSTEGGVSGVTKYAESSESSDWNDWVFNSTQSISEKYGNFTITGNDGSTYKFGVNASGLLESNRTITYTTNGKKTLYPSSKVGMEKATITIDVPQSSSSLGTRTITSNGTYSASTYGYDGFSSVTVNVSSSLPRISVGSLKSGSAPNRDKYVTVAKGSTNYVVITAGAGNTYQLEIRAGT